MALFFTSDEHYGHRNIIEFCKRPFADIADMREKLIENHNAKVGKGDITYHIGDMFWRTVPVMEAHEILNRLNGQHALVWGNHDELIERNDDLASRFIWIKDIARLRPCKELPSLVLCHYPFRSWRGSNKGSWHLYGHVHGEMPGIGLSMDVGVDAHNQYPVSFEEVMVAMFKKKGELAFKQMQVELQAQEFLARAEREGYRVDV